MKYWLIKSEPEEYSIDDLKKDKKTLWTGVRNYQARNFMMKDMSKGDLILFYHSNSTPPGVAGLAKVCASAVPDPLQFDSQSDYHDPGAKKDAPRWHCVEVEFVEKFENFLPLDTLKKESKLQGMPLFQKGQRLSVQPVTESQFKHVQRMGSPL